MTGLLVWAHSMCRSTAFFYHELSVQLGVPLKICVAFYDMENFANRSDLGFSDCEFEGINYELVGNDIQLAAKILYSHKKYHQIFGVYHINRTFRKIFIQAHDLGCKVAVFSEAPINMELGVTRRLLKSLYNGRVLPFRVRPHTRCATFFVNYSGDDSMELHRVGWDAGKIIPFGYFPPPILGSCVKQRNLKHHEDFHILCTGAVEHIRGVQVLIEACRLLRAYGLAFRVTITQEGSLRRALQNQATNDELPIDFRGYVPVEQLIALYEECSCFVACGLSEPWGIRVNDALNCGAPLIVSDGMGVKKLVNEVYAGRIFKAGDPIALASMLFDLMTDPSMYLKVAADSANAFNKISPKAASARLVRHINYVAPFWLE